MTAVENSLLTAFGEDALDEFQTLSTTEQAVHSGNTALGWLAMKGFTGLIGTYAPTSDTAIGSSVINLTGIESKAGPVWEGGTSNTPIIIFRKLTTGVTGLSTGVAYYVVKGTANSFECATTHDGTGIKVEGHALETGSTEIALMASGEDNTAVGNYALGSLTTGGGNIAIGKNAGSALTTGEENVVIGCEAGTSMQTPIGNVFVGFRAGFDNTTGQWHVSMGYGALSANTTGDANTAIGYQAMTVNTTGGGNTAIGYRAGYSLTKGSENTLVGVEAGRSLTTGESNVMIGAEAGGQETGSNKLYIANSNTTEPLIYGNFTEKELRLYTTKLGFYGVTPVARHAAIAEVPTTAATKTSPYGFTTEAQANDIVKAINELRKALKEVGLTS